jgi:hypothetical protein
MRTLDAILATPITGNAYGDHDLWQELYAVALSRSQPIADRAKAIRHMDKLTGVPESEGIPDEILVPSFVESATASCGLTETD